MPVIDDEQGVYGDGGFSSRVRSDGGRGSDHAARDDAAGTGRAGGFARARADDSTDNVAGDAARVSKAGIVHAGCCAPGSRCSR